MQFDLNILNGASGKVRVILQGQSGGDDGGIAITSSKITLSSSTGQQLYNGSLDNISGGRQIYMAGVLKGTVPIAEVKSRCRWRYGSIKVDRLPEE